MCILSIITINYNNYSGLKRTLESIEQQRESEQFQHVIIDGFSTDSSISLITDYVSRNQSVVWISERDAGIYNAMNKGISLATGKFISFLNSGDELAGPHCLKDVLYHLEAYGGCDILYGNIDIIAPSGKVKRRWHSGEFKTYMLWVGWMPPHPMFTVRSELITEQFGFNEEFSIAADYDLCLRLLLKSDICVFYLDKTLVRMEDGGVSSASLINIFRANTEVLRSWYRIKGFSLPFWVFVFKPLQKLFQFSVIGEK